MAADIDDLFKVHRLNPKGIAAAEDIARGFTELLRKVEFVAGYAATVTAAEKVRSPTAVAPPGARDLAIVRTKLQEASFFAKRAMAMNPENQETP